MEFPNKCLAGGKRKASEEWVSAVDPPHPMKKAKTESPSKEDEV